MWIIGRALGVLVEGLAVEANDTVSSRFLRDVQRVVCSFDQGITIHDPGMRPRRHTAAHRALQHSAVKRECVSLYCFTHALGEGNGRVEHRPWQQHHELLTTVTADAVDLARFLLQDSGELSQYHIARLMAVGVVHTLEAIQITQHHRERFVQPSRVFEHLIEALLQVAPVVESRKRVRLRHRQQTTVDF